MKLTNDFHNSETMLFAKPGDIVTKRRMARVRGDLCGVSGCTCSDATGRRGHQPQNDGLDLEPINWRGDYRVIEVTK